MPVRPDDRPLLVTADPDLLDDLLRLAAAAGVETQVAHDVVAARTGWSSARFVVLGDDLAGPAASRGLGHRPDVVLVGRDRGDDGVWDVASRLGVDSVVFLPGAETWLVDRLADAVEATGAHAVTVGVVGGRGCAGASTLAGALAVTGSSDRRTVLVDLDPVGGGADLLVGAELAEGLRWPDLASARGRVGGAALVASLPRADGLRVLSWDRGAACPLPVDAARSVLAAATRAHDLVVLDLPRHLDPVAEMAVTGADTVLLLVPAEVRAVAAAVRVAAVVGSVASELRVVVRGPAPSGLSAAEVAGILRLPLAGSLRPEAGLDRLLERGEAPARSGRGPLAELSRDLLDALPARGQVRPAA
jgi:secretion/DNA translocation related CpaE-like protein